MRINDFFLSSMTANRHYANSIEAIGKSAMRLSSGYRINCAADNPAGLAISEKMRAQVRGLNAAARNVQDAISLVQTAEGQIASINDILQRMNELAVQSATGTNAPFDRTQIAKEFEQLKNEINDIAQQANFNNIPLLQNGSSASAATVGLRAERGTEKDANGIEIPVTYITVDPFRLEPGDQLTVLLKNEDGGTTEYTYTYEEGKMMRGIAAGLGLPGGMYRVTDSTLTIFDEATVEFSPSAARSRINTITHRIQTGAAQGNILDIDIPVLNTAALGLDGVGIGTQEDASAAITAVKGALEKVVDARATLGAMQNRLEHKYNNLKNQAMNLAEAESRIRDTDIAEEMTNFVRENMRMQLAAWVMSQMNANAARVVELLKA